MREPGTIFSYHQLQLLLAGLTREGKSENFSPESLKGYFRKPATRQAYRDHLASLILFDHATVPVPWYLAENIDAEFLIREGLLEITDRDEVDPIKNRIARLYSACFANSRNLEFNPYSSRLKRLEDFNPRPPSALYLDAVEASSELQHNYEQLCDLTFPLMDGIDAIFEYYWGAHVEMHKSIYKRHNPRLFSPEEEYVSSDGMDLFAKMGIGISESLYPGDEFTHVYLPDHLERFDEVDSILLRPVSPMEYFDLSAYVAPDSHREFLEIHAFWRSLFELANMLHIAQSSGNTLFIPSTVKVKERAATKKQANDLTAENKLRVYRVYLKESGLIPAPKTFDDVLRMREDRNLRSLRRAVDRWSSLHPDLDNDLALIKDIQEEIKSAGKQVKRLEAATRFASLIGYVALPVGIAEAITGGAMYGLILSPIGPAIETFRALKLRKFGWVKFGR